jgi:hypothetical protein
MVLLGTQMKLEEENVVFKDASAKLDTFLDTSTGTVAILRPMNPIEGGLYSFCVFNAGRKGFTRRRLKRFFRAKCPIMPSIRHYIAVE